MLRSATSANFAGWAVIFASAAFGDFVRSHFAAQALYGIIDNCGKVEGGETPVSFNMIILREYTSTFLNQKIIYSIVPEKDRESFF